MSRSLSYYAQTVADETDFPVLEGEHRADVVIVGGGFTGVAAAVELAERGYQVILLEAHKIGWGATGRNGGQVTGSLSGDAAMTRQLRKQVGEEAADIVWRLRWRGHEIIETRVARYGIECDLKYGHLQAAYKPAHLRGLQAMYDEGVARGMGEQLTLLQRQDIPDYLETPLYHGGLFNARNMHLHSLNLCIGEARAAQSLGAQLYENTQVLRIESGPQPQVVTERGRVRANAVLLAGNAYHRLARPVLRGMLFPASLGNLVTEPLGDAVAQAINPRDIAVYDSRFVLDYYRLTADKRLMFGGGTNYSGRDSASVARELRPAIERTFPRLKGVRIAWEWTGMAGIVINRIPQLGRAGDNVYYCQGYSGHGIATSHVMAELVARAIDGDLRDFDRFAGMSHYRIPLPEWFGNQALALGMLYYRLMEHFR